MPHNDSARALGTRSRAGRGALAALAGLAGLGTLAHGMAMRFHVENTAEAMREASSGSVWLVGSAALLVAASALSGSAGARRVPTALVGLPVVVGVLPALLLPGNIVPFLTAQISGCLSLGALVWVSVSCFRR